MGALRRCPRLARGRQASVRSHTRHPIPASPSEALAHLAAGARRSCTSGTAAPEKLTGPAVAAAAPAGAGRATGGSAAGARIFGGNEPIRISPADGTTSAGRKLSASLLPEGSDHDACGSDAARSARRGLCRGRRRRGGNEADAATDGERAASSLG